MGRHYVPQRYLKNFEAQDRPGFIWLYDKQSGKSHLAPIAKVAQSKDYYSEEDEEKLRQVERMGKAVIAKLLNNEPISVNERQDLTLYIGTMLRRVPYRRRKAWEMLPGVLDATMQELRTEFTAAAGGDPSLGSEWLADRIEELEAARAKFEVTPPDEVIRRIRDPRPTIEILDAIYRMTWRILVAREATHFWTTDNPVFFFESDGIGTNLAEIAFPLSTTHALHGCSRTAPAFLVFYSAPEKFVREINRRLASTTERLAFSHRPESWMMPTLQKRNPYLSRFRW